MPEALPPGTVPIVGRDGGVYSVPQENVQKALAVGGRQATPQEIDEAIYGGTGGKIASALGGAAESATFGLSTAATLQAARTFGGEDAQAKAEQGIQGTFRTNPISRVIGQTLPYLAVPEAEVTGATSALGRAAEFAAPKFLRGAAEVAHMQGAQGISDDALDHDLVAESYWAHVKPGEAILGGLLNTGIAYGFKGLGKASDSLLGEVGGAPALVARRDAELLDKAIATGYKRGVTSDETADAVRRLHSMAEQRAAAPVEQQGFFDQGMDAFIKAHAKGSAQDERALRAIQQNGREAVSKLEDTIDGHTKEISQHVEDLANGLTRAQKMQFRLKGETVRELVDPESYMPAMDSAIRTVRELRELVTPPKLLPEPPFGPHIKEATQRARGVRFGDPQTKAEWIQSEATAARAQKLAEVQAANSEIIAAREAAIGKDVPDQWRYLWQRTDMTRLKGLRSAVDEAEMGLRAAREAHAGGDVAEAAARTHESMDGLKKILGYGGTFKKEGTEAGFKEFFYLNRLKPLLEDSNVWGERLASMQRDLNHAFSSSHKAVESFKRMFTEEVGQEVHGVGANQRAVPIYKAKTSAIKSFFGAPLGTDVATEDVVNRTLDAALSRGKAMRRHMVIDGATSDTLDGTLRASASLRQKLPEVSQAAADLQAVRGLRAREGSLGGHGVLGKLAGIVTSPTKTIETIAAFQKFARSVGDWARGESQGFLSGSSAPVLKGLTTSAERSATVKAIEDVKRFRSDPRALGMTLKSYLGGVPDMTPNVASSVASVAARAITYLSANAPEPLPPRLSDKENEPRYAPKDLEDFWRKKQLATNPKLLAQMWRSGQMRKDDVDLAEKIVPRLLESLRTQVGNDILAAKRNGQLRTLSYQDQLMLSWMLGRIMDSTQDPKFTRAMQESAANDPMNQAAFGQAATGGGRPSSKGEVDTDRYKTITERMESP